MNPLKKIVIGVTGASGSVYAKQLIEKLSANNLQLSEAGIVFTQNAIDVWNHEIGMFDQHSFPFKLYDNSSFFAPFASGSAGFDALIVCPCSMGLLGRIAQGIANDLISRTADVMLKERKKLVLVVRETPYNLIHINNLKIITEAGGIICPASPSFYSLPKTMEQLTQTVIDRVLQLTGFEIESFRWQSEENI